LVFRFLLVHPDGEPADPGMFVNAIPTWKVGDEFLAGTELHKFRVLKVVDEEPSEDFAGVFVVEPVAG
jgi:hypothetical protein